MEYPEDMISKVLRQELILVKSEESLVTLEYISKVNLSSYRLSNSQVFPDNHLKILISFIILHQIKYLRIPLI